MTPRSCTECPNHEDLSKKTNFMYGAGWVATGVMVVILGIIVAVFQSAFSEAAENRKQITGVKELVQETNLNLKHLMDAQGVRYSEASH